MSPDGNYLAVSNVKDELYIYEIRNLQKPVKYLKQRADINAFQWDKGDGNLFYMTDCNGSLTVLNGKTFTSLGQNVLTDCHNG
jgi:protease II